MSVRDISLPSGWCWATIGDICSADNGRAFKSSEWKRQGLPIVRIENLKDTNAAFNFFEGALDPRHLVSPGDLLFAWSGTPGTSFGAHIWRSGRAALNQHIFNVRFDRQHLNPDFFCYALNQNVQAYIEQAQGGVGLAHITKSKFTASSIPLPPRLEQDAMALALDSYITRLDKAVATLDRVKQGLKRYRASVLRAAVEGRLVPTEAESARQEGRDYEPAWVLLERILTERRRKWEETELAKLKTKGEVPKDDRWKKSYQAPVAPDTSMLPELPEGWCWATADMLADLKGGVTKGQRRKAAEVLREVPYLRVANVQRGFLDLSGVKTIQATQAEIDELQLRPGDVLFNEGGDRDKLGRGWIWNGELPECIHQNHVFRARMFTADLHPKLLSWYGNTAGQRYFFDEGKQTTNLASINLTKLRHLPVPIPPFAEQARMIDEVDRMLSLSDEAELLISQNAWRCIRLRQSILKWAFEGKLAKQDPTDEPASVLLARIRAEGEKATNANHKRPRGGRKRAIA